MQKRVVMGCPHTVGGLRKHQREKDFSDEMRSCALVRSHICWLKICLVLLRVQKERIFAFFVLFPRSFLYVFILPRD